MFLGIFLEFIMIQIEVVSTLAIVVIGGDLSPNFWRAVYKYLIPFDIIRSYNDQERLSGRPVHYRNGWCICNQLGR